MTAGSGGYRVAAFDTSRSGINHLVHVLVPFGFVGRRDASPAGLLRYLKRSMGFIGVSLRCVGKGSGFRVLPVIATGSMGITRTTSIRLIVATNQVMRRGSAVKRHRALSVSFDCAALAGAARSCRLSKIPPLTATVSVSEAWSEAYIRFDSCQVVKHWSVIQCPARRWQSHRSPLGLFGGRVASP